MAYPLGKFQFPIGRMTVSYNDTNSFPGSNTGQTGSDGLE